MKKLGKILGVVALLVGAGAIAAEMFPNASPVGTWRYKITVNIETPEGIKSGSAIREVRVALQPRILPEIKPTTRDVRGEAVVVDLGKRGILFALIDWNSYEEVWNAFPFAGDPQTLEGINYYKSLKLGTKAVLTKSKPKLVRFINLADPKTVQEVSYDDLAASFGEGVNFKEITIEMTDEPVTWEIEKWLPWLGNVKGKYLHGGSTSRNAPLGLHTGNFKVGETHD